MTTPIDRVPATFLELPCALHLILSSGMPQIAYLAEQLRQMAVVFRCSRHIVGRPAASNQGRVECHLCLAARHIPVRRCGQCDKHSHTITL